MAGWDDLGETAGSLPAGYLMDVTMLNTYIKAINERTRYCGFTGISPSNEPLPEIPDGASIFHNKKVELNGAQPYTFQGDYISILFYRVGRLMNKTWIKQAVWDDPLSTNGLTVDVAAYWSLEEIEELIGTTYFNILRNPYAAGIKLSDFQSAGIYNAIYQLYNEVFLYIDSRNMDTDVYLPVDRSEVDGIDESTEREPLPTVETFSDVTVKNLYDSLPTNVIRLIAGSFSESSFGRTQAAMSEKGNYGFSAHDGGYSFSYDASEAHLSNEYTMESFNHDGDFVKFDRKETIWVTKNCITDYDRDTFTAGGPVVFNQNIAGYPVVNAVLDTNRFGVHDGEPVRVLALEPIDSFIDVDGWHIKLGIDRPDYRYSAADFVFPISGTGAVDYTRKSTYFSVSYRNTGEPEGDLIYGLNVAGMVYNTLP